MRRPLPRECSDTEDTKLCGAVKGPCALPLRHGSCVEGEAFPNTRTGPVGAENPPLGGGKHSIRLYAGCIHRGKAPAPPKGVPAKLEIFVGRGGAAE